MGSEELPGWIKERGEPAVVRESGRARRIAVRLMLLPLAALVAVGAYLAFELPAGFHLAAIGAGACVFVLAIFWPLRCSRLTSYVFVPAAAAVNLGMALVYVHAVREMSGLIAMASTLLFTGAVGLLLVARTSTKLPRPTKVSLMTVMAAATLAGPLMYLFAGVDGAVLGGITEWLLVAALPFLVLTIGMSIVLLSYHESEHTLPSDKWV